MSTAAWGGLALALVAGGLAGNCMLPMKFTRRWHWENTWLVFSLVSLVVLPWALALLLAGNVTEVYRGLSPAQWLLPFTLGAGWGIAQVLFGLSIARLGLALGCAIIIGLGSLFGTLVPLFFKNREVLGTARGALILCGLLVMVAGIVVSAQAGRRREQGQGESSGRGYRMALALAVLCGLMAPMVNYSFAFGQDIADRAMRLGVPATHAGYAVWPIGLAGGLIPNLVYSFYLLFRNRSWGAFRGPWAIDAGMAALMGVFWMGAMSIYGVASVYLGALGTSVGWGLFQIFNIMAANVSGVLTGEWRNAPAGALRTLYAGLVLLACATVILATANR
ncbi:MAG TPA: L-rhamnose/proton symporter RhaT [Bryobacteraceae bacterium]|nr:L-rhamnose/proton symporter RhaT [Bryobacteraceae bacterium]